MKKLALYACVGAVALSFAACGNSNEVEQSTESGQISAETPESEENTTESIGSGEAASKEDYDQEDPWDEEVAWSEEMLAIREAVKQELGEDNYWPNMAIPAEIIEGTYGVSADMYDDYLGEMPMMMTHVDTLIVVKAKDGKAEAVESALNNYRDSKVSDTMQYPMNIGKIQASKVERIGNYVCFIQLGGDVTEAEENGEEAIILHCQEQNDRAMEVIAGSIEQ